MDREIKVIITDEKKVATSDNLTKTLPLRESHILIDFKPHQIRSLLELLNAQLEEADNYQNKRHLDDIRYLFSRAHTLWKAILEEKDK